MKRSAAKKIRQETKNISENLKHKYDFLDDSFLKKVNDDNLSKEDVIKIVAVLQDDVFKIKNNIVSIQDVSTLKTVPWSIGDVFLFQIDERFVVLHYKDLTTILFKDTTGSPIPTQIANLLPQNTTVKSNVVDDTHGTYSHLMSISNLKIIVDAQVKSFETFEKFTKSKDVATFRIRLYRALKSLQLQDFISKELREIENKPEFKQALKGFIAECKKYCVITAFAKEYNRILNEETLAFEKEGKPMDEEKIETARRAFLNEAKNYHNNTLDNTEVKKQNEEFSHSIEKQFPNESAHFKKIFQYLVDYKVDENFLLAIELISNKLDIDYNDLKTFFICKDTFVKTTEPSKPSVIHIAEDEDYILEKYSKDFDLPQFEVTSYKIHSLEQLLDELKTKNGLNNKEVDNLRNLYDKTYAIYNKDWINNSAKAVYKWAKQKRGNLLASEISETMAVCMRAHQIVSKGLITLRDIQILTSLLFLTATNGNFAEILTGEGKTTIISTLAVVKVLQGKQVDIITSNEVLANESLNDMRDFYYLFNIHASTNNYDPSYKDGPRSCYHYDIVYGSIGNFQFDYLRDSFEDNNTIGGRRFDFLILDEVDSLTVDNGTYIAKLAQPFPGFECLRYIYIKIWVELQKAEQEYKETVDEVAAKIVNEKNKTKTDEQLQDECDQHFFESITTMPDKLKEKIKGSNPLDSLNSTVIPNHLKAYCEEMLDKWIDNAIYVKYNCHENEDYVLKKLNKEDEPIIVPVDYANTGVILTNTIWSNGIHQFVQLKHNVKITRESLTSSFISNLGYIRLYNNNMYGMTGTLGSEAEQKFLSAIYNLKYMQIPTFKAKNFKEVDGIVVRDNSWVSCIIMDAYLKVKEQRSVLIICETISDVQLLKDNLESLIEIEDANWIKARYYYDESYTNVVLRDKVGPCEIIVATNIAGRGTDFKSTEDLEFHGGLHVCVTFLPCNKRVEQQAFGRTSRQGNYGTAQLIIRESNVLALEYTITESSTMAHIKEHRDCLEVERLAKKDSKIKEVLLQDKLFEEFAKTYKAFLREQQQVDGGIFLTCDLKERWAFWLRAQHFMGTEDVTAVYKKFLVLAKPILDGKISFNPYYAVQQADYFIKTDNYKDAKSAIDHAISLSKSDPCLYPAYFKLFEIRILNGKAVLDRFLKALKKIIFIPSSNDNLDYKKNAANALDKAYTGITEEVEHIKNNIIENKDFHKCLSASSEFSIDKNVLLKHVFSRYYALLTFQSHIFNLRQQLRNIPGGVVFHGKVENYIKDLKPSTENERNLKQNIHADELLELNNIRVSTIYNIREVYDVSNVVIRGAQIQIGAGLAIFAGCVLFPPAMIVGAPAAAALIGEGLTDIIIDLIRQGDANFDLQNYIKSKCVSYLISIITIGFSLLAQSKKVLELAMKACDGIATFLKKSTTLTGMFNKLALIFETCTLKLALTIQNISLSKSLLTGITLLRSQTIKIGLKHVGMSIGINLAGALVGEYIVSKSIASIVNLSRDQLLSKVREIVNERFENENILRHVNQNQFITIMEGLSRGTSGELAQEIFKDTVASLMQVSKSWKVKIAGLTIFSLGKCYDIYNYTNRFCEETIKAMTIEPTLDNSAENIEAIRAIIANHITDDIIKRIMALANSATQTFIVNPLMSKAIKKVMKKLSNQGQDDPTKEMSFKEISDAYTLLELPEGASEQDIKKAFKRLAFMYHPNSKKVPDADKFMAINRAKEFLLDLHSFKTNLINSQPTRTSPLALPAPIDLPMAHKGNIETLSRKMGEHIIVVNENSGEKTHFGSDYGGQPLVVYYKPPKEEIPGHYSVPGHEAALIPSAKNNCFYDSVELLLKLRGTPVPATTLRLEATSLSFANVKYNVINKFAQVFNNDFTLQIYNNIQENILIGGMAFTSTPLQGKHYPSGPLKIMTTNDTENAVRDFQSTLLSHFVDVQEANVVAPKSLKKDDGVSGITMNSNSKAKTESRIPVMMYVPSKEKDRKNKCMVGALHAKFKNHPVELKLVTVSGSTPFIQSIVPAADGIYEYKNTKYKSVQLKYSNKDGYIYIDPGKVDVTEIYDVYTRTKKKLQLTGNLKDGTCCCAAVKLMSHLGKYIQENSLTIDGDIHMTETYFSGHDFSNVNEIVAEDSCNRCKIILPQMTGKQYK